MNGTETTGREVATQQKTEIRFVPYGSSDEIKLSVRIIQNLIAVPTKTGKTCSEKEAMRFLMLCQAKRLNPFEGDCFLIGYDSKDGVATFSLITAHQAYLKRAEIHPEFDGMKSGVIVSRNDKVEDLEGDFHLPDDTVIGGWATVFFKTRKIPMTRRLRLARFRKPFGVWNDDPGGMIVKCAEADALRSSFPTMLGGLFMREEIDMPMAGNGKSQDFPLPRTEEPNRAEGTAQAAESMDAPAVLDATGTDLAPAKPQPPATSPQLQLRDYVTGEGFTFEHLHSWASETGQYGTVDPENVQKWEDIPEKEARRLLRIKGTILKQALEAVRAKEAR